MKLNSGSSILIVAAALALCATVAHAQTAAAGASPVTIIVTADRMPRPISETIASATVVTARELRENGARTVADALRLVPGVALSQGGEMGSVATLSIRGFSGHQFVVMVDGQRISGASFASYDLSRYPLSDVSRVEVIRGPASMTYGSDAMGGVINIITKQPLADGGEATLGFGSFGRLERSLLIHEVGEKLSLQVGVSAPAYGGARPNADFRATNTTLRVNAPDAGGWALGASAESYRDEAGEPGQTSAPTLLDRFQWRRSNVGLTAARGKDGARTELRVYQLGQTLDDNLVSWGSTTHVEGTTRGVEATFHGTNGPHRLTSGLEYRDEGYYDYETSGFGAPVEVDEGAEYRGAFLQDHWKGSKANEVTIGLRQDDHVGRWSRTTGSVGTTHRADARTTVRASLGTGFRAPSLVDLYYANPNWGFTANPALQPEKSSQLELGVHVADAKRAFDVAVFHARVRDKIAFVPTGGWTGTMGNVARVKQMGAEATYSAAVGRDKSISIAYSYVDAQDEATGTQLLKVPRNRANASVAWRLPHDVLASASARWSSDKSDFGGATVRGATVVDLSLAKREGATVAGRGRMVAMPYLVVRNATGVAYEEAAGYPSEPRGAEAGVRVTW